VRDNVVVLIIMSISNINRRMVQHSGNAFYVQCFNAVSGAQDMHLVCKVLSCQLWNVSRDHRLCWFSVMLKLAVKISVVSVALGGEF